MSGRKGGQLIDGRTRLLRVLRHLLLRKVAGRARLLAREAAGARGPSMVLWLVSREMKALGPEIAPFLLREIVVGASRRVPGCGEALCALGDVRTLAALADGGFMSEVVMWARRHQVAEAVDLFAAAPPRREHAGLDEIEAGRPAPDSAPLGTRKSLARRPHPATVERMLREQHPQVVRNLLDNPRLTEELVVKMASLRPTSADVLAEIGTHRIWSARTAVRRALVFNPFTPPRLAHAFLPLLMVGEVVDVCLSPSLHPSLGRAAKRYLLLRMGEMTSSERRQFTRSWGAALKRIFLGTYLLSCFFPGRWFS
jgi:hypothetical protein